MADVHDKKTRSYNMSQIKAMSRPTVFYNYKNFSAGPAACAGLIK